MQIQSFFDRETATVTYVVSDPVTRQCAVIDPVYDYDLFSGRLTTTSADQVISHIQESHLHLTWILETHIHADHLTAARYLQQKLGGKIGIGSHIRDVLAHWVPIFHTAQDTPLDGSQFDVLFADGASFKIGELSVTVMHTPGHTPACVSYCIDDAVFVGDAMFMPYVGTARTDFPGGSAETLYQSLQKILALPDTTRLFTCHDYPLQGNSPAWESTVGEQKQKNIMLNDTVTEQAFISNRKAKDLNKPVPKLLLPALQFNMRAGSLGKSESNGVYYIKVPVTIA
jgi:glyoxylase-like metal-dependent hydrolase (beta-lactamase superfamily II)